MVLTNRSFVWQSEDALIQRVNAGSHQRCVQMCATFSTSSHRTHKAEDGSVVSVSVCVSHLSQQIHNLKVVQPAGAERTHTHTHGGELFDHRLKGVIVSNFIPLLSYSEQMLRARCIVGWPKSLCQIYPLFLFFFFVLFKKLLHLQASVSLLHQNGEESIV